MKLIIKEVIKDKTKPWDILKAVLAPEPKCKKCKKEEKRNGSAYCQKCSDSFKSGVDWSPTQEEIDKDLHLDKLNESLQGEIKSN